MKSLYNLNILIHILLVIALFTFQSCGEEALFETSIEPRLASECNQHIIVINLQGQTYRSDFTNDEWMPFREQTDIDLNTEEDGSIMTFTFNNDLLCADTAINLSSKHQDCEVLTGEIGDAYDSVRFDLDACTRKSEYLVLLVCLAK